MKNRKENTLTISMPMMSGDEISRLEALIESKETLLKKSLGTESVAVEEEDGKLNFSWFKADSTADEKNVYMLLVTRLCESAKKAKRINAKDHPVDNEKYAFRCFLLRLGFIGDTYKEARKVLLKNFTGSSAYKDGGKKDEDAK